jgi:hypothetical protein
MEVAKREGSGGCSGVFGRGQLSSDDGFGRQKKKHHNITSPEEVTIFERLL